MLSFDSLPPKVREYFKRNITISVAFVKSDNVTVRHMAFRRNLKSYVKSGAEKTEKQSSMLQNNNLMLVYDTNLYIKALAETGDKEKAAKSSFRNFRLQNVLGFLCGGEFFDMREENQIKERFGEEVYKQLTKNMVYAMKTEEDSANETLKLTDEPGEINEEGKSLASPVEFAEKLVQAGVIKDEFTDLSGKNASSQLSFIVLEIMKSLGI